jgi:DNA polymerase-3 subunit epsilon
MEKLKPDIDALPRRPGVYYFYRDETLLYVGKSVDIKARVLSHCYAAKSDAKERKLVESANHIACQQTPGELSALLLESREIKRIKPLYNRRLRRKVNLLSWHLSVKNVRFGAGTDDENTPVEITLAPHVWPPEDGSIQFGLYRNRYQATEDWKNLARDYSLCEKTMGVASNQGAGPCFAYQLKRCRGACVGQESPADHDARLRKALAEKGDLAWPYDSAVAIVEMDEAGIEHYHVLEKWFMYGEASTLDEARLLLKQKSQRNTDRRDLLDLDEYRIVLSFLRSNKHSDLIQLMD